jgi:hypothetical protein
MIGGAQIATANLVKGLDGATVEGRSRGAGDPATVFNVGAGLRARQRPQDRAMGQTVGHVHQAFVAQESRQGRLSRQHEAHHQAAIHLEIGQDAQDAKDLRPDAVAIVQKDHGPHAVRVQVIDKALLQAAHQDRISSRRLQSHGGSDLAAQITFGQLGYLHIMDPVTGLGQTRHQGAQQHRLAGARRGDEGSRHPLVQGGEEALEGLFVDRVHKAVLDPDLTGKGKAMKAEAAA